MTELDHTPSKALDCMDCLNLGCGRHCHPAWTNVDFTSTTEGVIAHNLRQGLPFPSASFDVVYHSHVLEHLPKVEAPGLLQECFRVLRPQGILRVVIPDLEQIARLYLEALEQAIQGSREWSNHYNWILLEMYDQTVREHSGGAMASYLAAETVPNQNFVIQRLGREAKNLIEALQQYRQQSSPVEVQPPSEREGLLKNLLGDADYQALQIGRFRQSGEVHHWMYDRYSLSHLLEQAGFEQIRVCRADESAIPNFGQYQLDVEADGQIRKPDSLYVEAIKPVTAVEAPQMAESKAATENVLVGPKQLEDLPQFQELQQAVQQLQVKLERSQRKLKTTQKELEEARNTIAGMSSSKFWKLRSLWMMTKRRFGFTERN